MKEIDKDSATPAPHETDWPALDLPEILENYREYAPKIDVKTMVKELLKSVPSGYLADLKRVVLTNRSSLSRDQRCKKTWQRGRKHQFATSLGVYYRTTRSQPACVWLFVDNILQQFPLWTLRIPLVPYMIVGDVLYHEIGHHIHRVHRPVYEGRENVAEDWRRKLTRTFFRRHYWYLVPVVPVLLAVVKAMQGITNKVLQARKSRVAV